MPDPQPRWKVGDRVTVRDGSEAHGDRAVVWQVQTNGIVIVELTDHGCLWPCGADELDEDAADA
jgi:hypothetical protein